MVDCMHIQHGKTHQQMAVLALSCFETLAGLQLELEVAAGQALLLDAVGHHHFPSPT